MDKLKTKVVIVTPALADANNGNWRTARRWAGLLTAVADVRAVNRWPDRDEADSEHGDSVMLALHARRSAESIAAWHACRGRAGLGVVLTGTDLYRDIAGDAAAQQSLAFAEALVVLQERAPAALPPEVRHQARVIFQSSTTRRPLAKSSDRLRVVMVGHLRDEKSPQTLFAAARRLAGRKDIRIDHIGSALDPELGEAARATMADVPNYRWLGGLPHETVRRRIQRAHLLVHASRMEGGAHVIIEAVNSGTPVLASRVDGNVGMLGADYGGYFPWGDAQTLADLLVACQQSRRRGDDGLPGDLARQCQARAPLFAPAAERRALHQLVVELSGAA